MSDALFSVIVVEDEKLLAKNIAKKIETQNPAFKVTQIFGNGLDALDYIKENPPHVIFTDIQMPLMNGIELTEQVKTLDIPSKCIILTGYADFGYAKSAMQFGVVEYLLKPVNEEELKGVLDRLYATLMAANPDLSDSVLTSSARKPEEITALVKEYIRIHYAEPIDLNILADNLGFSPSYLTKVFSKCEDTTPSKYVRNYRMNIAKQMLATDASIEVISSAVGYTDQFHFSKSFKQTCGISPTDYRKSLEGKA